MIRATHAKKERKTKNMISKYYKYERKETQKNVIAKMNLKRNEKNTRQEKKKQYKQNDVNFLFEKY